MKKPDHLIKGKFILKGGRLYAYTSYGLFPVVESIEDKKIDLLGQDCEVVVSNGIVVKYAFINT